MSGPDQPMRRGPNTHKMDAPSDVTTWTVIHTVRNVPTDDGRGMTLRDEWWEIPSFVIDEIDAARAAAPPVEPDTLDPTRDYGTFSPTTEFSPLSKPGSVPPAPAPVAGLRAVGVIASLHAANHDSGWTPKDWNLFVNACAALDWKALAALLDSTEPGLDCWRAEYLTALMAELAAIVNEATDEPDAVRRIAARLTGEAEHG